MKYDEKQTFIFSVCQEKRSQTEAKHLIHNTKRQKSTISYKAWNTFPI